MWNTANFLIIVGFIAAGYFLAKAGVLSQKRIDKISNAILYFFTPFLIIYSVSHFDFQITEILNLIGITVLNVAVIFVFAWGVFKIFGISGGVFFLPVLFTNTANFGYPVNFFFWGAGSFPYAASYSVTIAVLLFTFGIYLITPELPFRKRLKNVFGLPVIYAYVVGILLHYTGMPEFVDRVFFIFSIPAIPLMLIIAGSSLIYSRWKLDRKVAAGLIARFGGGFLVFLLLLLFFDLKPLYMKVIVTNVFLPSAVMNYILALKFKQNKDYVANMIGFSTLVYIFIFLGQLLFFHKLF